MRNSQIPKTVLREIEKRADIIDSYHVERDGFSETAGPWSVWIYLKPGYYCVYTDTGSIHEATARDLVDAIRSAKPRPFVCGCGHQFDQALGAYGCPNCCGDNGPAFEK